MNLLHISGEIHKLPSEKANEVPEFYFQYTGFPTQCHISNVIVWHCLENLELIFHFLQ